MSPTTVSGTSPSGACCTRRLCTSCSAGSSAWPGSVRDQPCPCAPCSSSVLRSSSVLERVPTHFENRRDWCPSSPPACCCGSCASTCPIADLRQSGLVRCDDCGLAGGRLVSRVGTASTSFLAALARARECPCTLEPGMTSRTASTSSASLSSSSWPSRGSRSHSGTSGRGADDRRLGSLGVGVMAPRRKARHAVATNSADRSKAHCATGGWLRRRGPNHLGQ